MRLPALNAFRLLLCLDAALIENCCRNYFPNAYVIISTHLLCALMRYLLAENLNMTINKLKGKFSVAETKAMQLRVDKEMQQVRFFAYRRYFKKSTLSDFITIKCVILNLSNCAGLDDDCSTSQGEDA